MSFLIYDMGFLAVFVIFLSIFLYRGKKNLKKDGLLLLYRTQLGVKFINYIGGRFKKTLKFLSYISITLGYLLMAGMIYLFGKIVWIYIASPAIVKQIKVPPIMPLIPYFPQAFKLTFLPDFNFTYWIIILAVVAISHEFAHGIFMKRYGVKIKSTGFGFFPFFLPVFLAAFVEQDEKSFSKSGKFEQMSILAAGTFANLLTAVVFFFVLISLFSSVYTPSGIVFDSYTIDVMDVSSITIVNNIEVQNESLSKIVNLMDDDKINKITAGGKEYTMTENFLEAQLEDNSEDIYLYQGPAYKVQLEGAITNINGVNIGNLEEFREELLSYSPGEKIKILTQTNEGKELEFEVILDEHPEDAGKPYLGIIFREQRKTGVIGRVVSLLSSFKEPHVYYKPISEAGEFLYNLLWWLVLISISIALVNMLPVGIFDGGRFFYLTIWGLTGNEKIAKKAFGFVTYLFLVFLLLIMLLWAWSFL